MPSILPVSFYQPLFSVGPSIPISDLIYLKENKNANYKCLLDLSLLMQAYPFQVVSGSWMKELFAHVIVETLTHDEN